MATRDTTKTDSRLAARCAAVASLGAAVIHFAVTPMHWRDWLPSGLSFAALAAFQLIWAFVAWSRPGAVVFAAGIAANVGAAALWVMSCTAGLPVGPSAGQPEAAGAAGIAVLLLQCYVVMGSVWAWSRKYEPEKVSGFGRAFVLLGANAIVAGAVTVGLAATLQGHHDHHPGGAVEAQGHATHEAHMDGGAHMEGGHHPSQPQPQPQSPPAAGVMKPSPAPTPEAGLPVTDMALDTDGGLQEAGGATRPAPAAVAPATQPEPAQQQPAAPDSDLEADGHQHQHED
ncbi:MAG: hypothetical protein ACKVP6_11230 [Mycobacterium sp.]